MHFWLGRTPDPTGGAHALPSPELAGEGTRLPRPHLTQRLQRLVAPQHFNPRAPYPSLVPFLRCFTAGYGTGGYLILLSTAKATTVGGLFV